MTMRTIKLNSLTSFDKNRLGTMAVIADCTEIIDEDCDVILPDGSKVVFRKGAINSLAQDQGEAFAFFAKMAKSRMNYSRGMFALKEIVDKKDSRFTKGQVELLQKFLNSKAKGLGEITTIEGIDDFLQAKPERLETSKWLFRITEVLKDFPGWGDSEGKNWWPDFVREWGSISPQDQPKLADKVLLKLKENSSRGNRCASIVMGAFDRTSRSPYARLTTLSQKFRKEYDSYAPMYKEVDQILKESLPEKWNLQRALTDKIDPQFSMHGTAFTTMTVNCDTIGAYHYDGQNLDGGVGILSSLTQGEYEGKELLFPELGLAFDIRPGDFIAGDTTNLVHGNLPYRSKSEDASRVSFVWYARDGFKSVESAECELIRKDFLDSRIKENKRSWKEEKKLHPEAKSPSWSGISEGMWTSQSWIEFKEGKGFPQCSCTNYAGT